STPAPSKATSSSSAPTSPSASSPTAHTPTKPAAPSRTPCTGARSTSEGSRATSSFITSSHWKWSDDHPHRSLVLTARFVELTAATGLIRYVVGFDECRGIGNPPLSGPPSPMQPIARRQWLRLALGTGGAVGLGACSAPDETRTRPRQVVSKTARALGTHVSLTVVHERRDAARRAIDAARGELDLIEDVMSLYRPHSQLCRLNRAGVLEHPHPHLVAVLRKSAAIASLSEGAFDVTVQPLWALYSAAQRRGNAPDPDAIAQA